MKLLEESGYDGPRHFKARPSLPEDSEAVWDVAAACMRTYLALAAKSRRFRDDPDIRDALEDAVRSTWRNRPSALIPERRLRGSRRWSSTRGCSPTVDWAASASTNW